MSAAFEEARHARAGDGRFAPMDARRPAAGQVGDAFDAEPVDHQSLAAAHEALMQQFWQANADFEQKPSRYRPVGGGTWQEVTTDGEVRSTRHTPRGQATSVPSPDGGVLESRVEKAEDDVDARESFAHRDEQGRRVVHTMWTTPEGHQTHVRTVHDKQAGTAHRIIAHPDGRVDEEDLLTSRAARNSGLDAAMVDVEASDGFTYRVPRDEYEHGDGSDFAVDPTVHRRWGHDHDGEPLEREASWHRGESLSHFIETSHAGERVRVEVAGPASRTFVGTLSENDSGDWEVADDYGDAVDVTSFDVSSIRRLEDEQ